MGSSRNRSEQTNTVDQAAGSEVLAGGRLALVAAGDKSLSDVTVRGSTLAGQDVLIEAADEIRLEAARNLNEQHSRDKGSSASIGIGISLGSDNKLGVTVSGSVSRGKADGTDLSHTVTQVSGGSTVTLKSGGDTALQGAVVTAPQVLAEVGRDLKIESLQDTAKYDSKSQSVGGSVTFGYGAGGNANYSGSKVNADYAAVGEQAGIRAGDGGFQIQVAGATELIGGAITSSQAAIDAGKNRLTTATLEARDIANRSQFSASAVTVSAGTSGGMAGAYKDSGDERSTTRSTISAGQTVLSAADEASRAVLEGLDRGATNDATTGKLAQGWDGQKLQQQSRLNAQIVADFGAQASKDVGDYAAKKTRAYELAALQAEESDKALSRGDLSDSERAKYEALRADAQKTMAEQQATYDAWKEGGASRVALHTVVGGLTGDLSGALGAAGSAAAAPLLDDFQKSVKDALVAAGMEAESKDKSPTLADGLAKLAAGLVAGTGGLVLGADGGSAALNQDFNNRQLHPSEVAWIEAKAKEYAEQNGLSVDEAKRRLTQQALREVDFAWRSVLSDGDDQKAKAFLAQSGSGFVNELGQKQQLFTTTGNQLTRMELYAESADRDFYKTYAQPGVTRDWKTGLPKEVRDSAGAVKQSVFDAANTFLKDPVQGTKDAASALWAALPGLPGAIKDSFIETGTALGEGAAVALDKDLSNKLNGLYGTDVSDLQKATLGLRAVVTVGSITGVGKAVDVAETIATKTVVKSVDKAKNGVYIPRGLDDEPIPLPQRAVPGVGDVPLPLAEAQGAPHTVLGGKLARDGETVYRQTATFPGGTWPALDGMDVPWGRVDWTDHGYLPGPAHPDPHIHEFYYDIVQKQWQIGPAKPFFEH